LANGFENFEPFIVVAVVAVEPVMADWLQVGLVFVAIALEPEAPVMADWLQVGMVAVAQVEALVFVGRQGFCCMSKWIVAHLLRSFLQILQLLPPMQHC
jgi:hypothetical protein